MKTINKIKNTIELNNQEIERLEKEFKAAIELIKRENELLKIELADMILNNIEEETKEEIEDIKTFVEIEFKPGGKTYHYIYNGDDEIKSGDFVEVDSFGTMKSVKVLNVFTKNINNMPLSNYQEAYK